MDALKRLLTWGWLALASGVSAQAVVIANPGFEQDVVADGVFALPVPAGWSVYDPSGIVNQTVNAVGIIRPNIPQTYFPGGAPEGQQAALVFLAGSVNAPAGLQQTLAATLQAQTRYTLQVDIGNIGSGVSLPGSADGGGQFYNLAGFPGYRIELLAGGVLLGADESSAGAIAEGEWRTASLQVLSPAAPAQLGQALTIRLVNRDLPGTPAAPAIEVDFDHVRLTAAPVPEPQTAALWLGGLLALGHVARRRRADRAPG